MATILLIAGHSAVGAPDDGADSAIQRFPSLPAGEGRDVTIDRCSDGCHSPSIVAVEGLGPEDWVVMIEEMIGLGARISDDEFNAIYLYLVNAFPGP